jgi:hypothetical protein
VLLFLTAQPQEQDDYSTNPSSPLCLLPCLPLRLILPCAHTLRRSETRVLRLCRLLERAGGCWCVRRSVPHRSSLSCPLESQKRMREFTIYLSLTSNFHAHSSTCNAYTHQRYYLTQSLCSSFATAARSSWSFENKPLACMRSCYVRLFSIHPSALLVRSRREWRSMQCRAGTLGHYGALGLIF